MRRNLIKIKKLFERLEKAHNFYEAYRNHPDKLKEIEIKVQPLVRELERHGVSRELSITLLIFGGKAEPLSKKEETELRKAKLLNKQFFFIKEK